MRETRWVLWGCLAVLAGSAGCAPQPVNKISDRSELFVTDVNDSASDADVWEAALSPRKFSFPRDHAAHEDFRIEWWYYTGHLKAEDKQYGYQLTFFRTGLDKDPQNPSKWAVRDLYTTHFGLSDVSQKKHYCFQKSNRRGVGQAGADSDVYRVWNGDWTAELDGQTHRLRAADSGIAIELQLRPEKPPVLHGENGLSQKGPTPGNASYYYSLTRMATAGNIHVDGQRFEVTGESWMDHEFSTSFLEPGQMGWDWFSIQLDDGTELMLYRMRLADGGSDPNSSGSYVSADGRRQHLSSSDFKMTPGEIWESPVTGARYPLHWEIEIPRLQLTLRTKPAFAAQEMVTAATTGISYWEGAIDVVVNGDQRGQGYMELTGYVGQGLGSLFD